MEPCMGRRLKGYAEAVTREKPPRDVTVQASAATPLTWWALWSLLLLKKSRTCNGDTTNYLETPCKTSRNKSIPVPSSSPEEQPWKSSHCDDRDHPAACGTGRRSQSSPGSTRVPNRTFRKPADFQDPGMVQSTHFQEGGAAFLASACIWSHLGLWKQSTLGHSFEKLNNYLTACFQREFWALEVTRS